jgi:hypothetical protein
MKFSIWFYFAVFISILCVFGGCQIRQHWHVENYIVEGSGYFRIAKKPVKETKEYFVCGEKIRLGIYPQQTIITHKPTYSYKKTGPYKIRISFTPGYNDESKKILIHDVKRSSNLGNGYNIAEQERFPINLVPEPYWVMTVAIPPSILSERGCVSGSSGSFMNDNVYE